MIYIYYILHIIYIYLSPYPTFGDTRARARGVTLGGGDFYLDKNSYIYGAHIYIYIYGGLSPPQASISFAYYIDIYNIQNV